jgi:hypothetical protein
LLLLGPPSGGKSTLAILLKRGLEEYSRTDAGALYAIQGSPMHESPLNLIPASLRPAFRETYGVELQGELSPWARERLEREYEGDYLRMPVERIFLSEASRVGIGTYAPHDPTTADIADLVVVGRGLCRQPRRPRDDRDPEGQARVSLPAADADAGKERQGLAIPADPPGRDHPGAHQSR